VLLTPDRPADAAATVARDLWRRVRLGELAEGEALREAQLADRYGHSRHTVRQALRQLRAEGLVEHDPHRSARVRELTSADVRDLFWTRTVLELEALKRVIADDAPLDELEATVVELERLEGDRPGELEPHPDEIDADLAFHHTLVDSAGSPRLTRAYESLLAELRLAFVALGGVPGPVGDHRPMLDAIAARDLAEAERLLEFHLRDGLRICLANRS
jgi:DNA-binding GntR family transcriptional regulator